MTDRIPEAVWPTDTNVISILHGLAQLHLFRSTSSPHAFRLKNLNFLSQIKGIGSRYKQ